jgi:signal peptidase II
MPHKYKILALAIGVDVIFFDQLIKYFILKKIPEVGISFISTEPITMGLTLVKNVNIAFGIPLPQVAIFAIIAIILGLLGYFIFQNFKTESKLIILPLIAVVAAAVSNLVDRLIHGGVIDYFSISTYNYQYPIFNLADAVIVIGIVILFIINFKQKKI